jgi:hypothetical protein
MVGVAQRILATMRDRRLQRNHTGGAAWYSSTVALLANSLDLYGDCLCRTATEDVRHTYALSKYTYFWYAKCETILYRRSCKLAWEITSFLQIAWLLYHVHMGWVTTTSSCYKQGVVFGLRLPAIAPSLVVPPICRPAPARMPRLLATTGPSPTPPIVCAHTRRLGWTAASCCSQ